MSDPKLLLVSGSLRKESVNSLLVREAARLFGPATVTEANLRLPLYDGDLEEAEGIPAEVDALANQIADADAVAISTPEYNKGPSGVLKNALDWVSRTKGAPWKDKPVAVMSATAGRAGGERAQMVLRGFLVPFRPRLLTGPEIHLASAFQELDDQGRLKSERYTASLKELMEDLRAQL